jgi:hypothetical protein
VGAETINHPGLKQAGPDWILLRMMKSKSGKKKLKAGLEAECLEYSELDMQCDAPGCFKLHECIIS